MLYVLCMSTTITKMEGIVNLVGSWMYILCGSLMNRIPHTQAKELTFIVNVYVVFVY